MGLASFGLASWLAKIKIMFFFVCTLVACSGVERQVEMRPRLFFWLLLGSLLVCFQIL